MLQTKELPIDSISTSPNFHRDQYDPTKHQDLIASIKQVGIVYPLITIETESGPMLISGYRRFLAAKEIGLPSVPCYILKIGIDDAEIMRLHENLFREDISPFQEAIAFARLEQTYHFTRDKVSKMIGKSKSYVTQRLQILDWPRDLQDALATSQVSYSIARELSAVTALTELKSLLHTVITSGATVRTVIQWVQDWKSSISTQQPSTPGPPTSDIQGSNTQSNIPCYFCENQFPNSDIYTIHICTDCFSKISNQDDSQPPSQPQTNHTHNPPNPTTTPPTTTPDPPNQPASQSS